MWRFREILNFHFYFSVFRSSFFRYSLIAPLVELCVRRARLSGFQDMDCSNHYEVAFEAYLQQQRLCYIAVDESRRTLLDEGPVKSLDFIVYGAEDENLLVDVKGRRFPGGSPQRPRPSWQCWAERADIDGLARWAEQFGEGYKGLLVFMYQIIPPFEVPADTPDLWEWHDRRYLLRAVAVDLFRRHMRTRSPRWGTVDMPGATFRQLARPFSAFLHDDGTLSLPFASCSA
jgi:hypothetical protein